MCDDAMKTSWDAVVDDVSYCSNSGRGAAHNNLLIKIKKHADVN